MRHEQVPAFVFAVSAVMALSGCAAGTAAPVFRTRHPATEERVVIAGNDIVYVGADDTGIMFVGHNNLNIEFLDTDSDGSTDFIRYAGPRNEHNCNNTLEDYDADGLFDMRWYHCDDAAQAFAELRVGEQWRRLESADQDLHVSIDGVRRRVILDHGRMRMQDDLQPPAGP